MLGSALEQAAAALLHAAESLWRGEPLADFLSFEPFAQAEITRLTELRLTTLEDRLDAPSSRPGPPRRAVW